MCGVAGIIDQKDNVSYELSKALKALQHRGQETAGIFVAGGGRGRAHHGYGTVDFVFSPSFREKEENHFGVEQVYRMPEEERPLDKLKGRCGVGAVRYSTQGDRKEKYNIQPFLGGGSLVLCHNGNIVNTAELRKECLEKGFCFKGDTDTEVIAGLISVSEKPDFGEALVDVARKLRGAFSLAILYEEKLYALRDRYGIRPLSVGKSSTGWAVAFETCVFPVLRGFKFYEEVAPGEIWQLSLDAPPVKFLWRQDSQSGLCLFEYVYFSRPDSYLGGVSVHEVRKELGRILFRETGVRGDVTVAVPDSGVSAALGFAQEQGNLDHGIIRTHYAGRTFILPPGHIREDFARVKFAVNRESVSGKKVVVIDDSIVRATVSQRIVRLLKQNGAEEIHVLSSAPKIDSPCYLGIDIATPGELIAANKTTDEICRYIGADSLHYLSGVSALVRAVNNVRERTALHYSGQDRFCHGCFEEGIYAVLPLEKL